MLTLGVFKALTLLCEAAKYHYVAATGSPDGWNIAYYIFTSFRGLMFFTVVVLIGTGWSYMKPFLGDRERKILMVVIPLQVFANIAIVVSDEENPAVQDWAAWKDVFHLVDIICCCAVLFPIVWSIKHLREAAQTDGKAARNMEKLTLFRQFYVMVVVYIYFTRIVVYLLESTVRFEYVWLSTGASELATLAFYVWTAVRFRPHKENPYLKLHQEEIEL
jgi:G protein-coupled receptor 107